VRYALTELLLRGAVSLSICTVVAVFMAGLLSVLAEKLPKGRGDTDPVYTGSIRKAGGDPSKGKSNGHRLATAKVP
jgi:hypothetical protein